MRNFKKNSIYPWKLSHFSPHKEKNRNLYNKEAKPDKIFICLKISKFYDIKQNFNSQ